MEAHQEYLLGGIWIKFRRPVGAREASKAIRACAPGGSSMRRGIVAVLQKEPAERTAFEQLVWSELPEDEERVGAPNRLAAMKAGLTSGCRRD